MRDDMDKKLVERGSHKSKYDKTPQATKISKHPHDVLDNWEKLPKKERMNYHYGYGKSFRDYLNPLKRFLRKQVNRPWDKIYSEICSKIKLSSTVQRHILEHLGWEVETKVIEKDKKIYHSDGYRELWHGDLYVCPRSGILKKYRKNKHEKKKWLKKWRSDQFNKTLESLCNTRKSITRIEDDVTYKYFYNNQTEEFDIKMKANKTHAKHDFHACYSKWVDNTAMLNVYFQTDLFRRREPYWQEYLKMMKQKGVIDG